ncbi:unnamed protein product [Arctia plantaginis]|uniref:Uncharacterized protein n=1 Tax=Arctia plantaginis TaxID=874455 RepID=A0A8S1B0S2_ARCPL|nr:unnamed protein product [Arctia plantaginis]
MDRWLINNSARKSNVEKVPLSSSKRPSASTYSYSESQHGTSFQSSNYVEDQKEQLDPQTPANQINTHQTKEHLELKRIYLGVDSTHLLTEVENKENCEVQKIFQSAKLFCIEAIVQIKKRFVFEDVHNDSSVLNPKNANDLQPTSLYEIAKSF